MYMRLSPRFVSPRVVFLVSHATNEHLWLPPSHASLHTSLHATTIIPGTRYLVHDTPGTRYLVQIISNPCPSSTDLCQLGTYQSHGNATVYVGATAVTASVMVDTLKPATTYKVYAVLRSYGWHDASKCWENGKLDGDCCALRSEGSCTGGAVIEWRNSNCWGGEYTAEQYVRYYCKATSAVQSTVRRDSTVHGIGLEY